MSSRLRGEEGQGLIELVAAMTVLSIALMALMAGYDSAFLSLHKSAQKTDASTLANQQLELYAALPYASVGLDETTLTDTQTPGSGAYDSRYVSDEATLGDADSDGDGDALSDTDSDGDNPTDAVIPSCGSTSQCLPIQSVTTSGRRYRLETFIRNVTNPNNNTGIRWSERVVTVIVQDASTSANVEILRDTTAFDRGPS